MKGPIELQKLLIKLCKEFEVPIPGFFVDLKDSESAGCYFAYEIHLHKDIIGNLAEAIRVLRHEFAHYLQDLRGYHRRTEIQARKFEKNLFALGERPRSQTSLFKWIEEVVE